MINNKGYNFASDYWSHNVYQQAKNAITSPDKNPYGVKGDENWEYIALSEGWANYREWNMCLKYLKYNTLSQTTNINNTKGTNRNERFSCPHLQRARKHTQL